MTQETRVVRSDDRAVALQNLETSFALAVKQRELLENYIKERLKPDKHFYTVSDGQKPSLTKEGAELICLPHNLKARLAVLSGPESPPLDESPYQITIKVEMYNGDKFAGEGVGSASSMTTRKDGTRVQRQKDPGLRHNATLKMAYKSAYIAATLSSTAASEFFTQDMEDIQATEGTHEPDKSQHWCEKHNTRFFKTEKMRAYAHPIAGTKEWCSEPVEKKEPEQPAAGQPEKQPETAVHEQGEASGVKEVEGQGEGTIHGLDVKALEANIKKAKLLTTWQSWIDSKKWLQGKIPAAANVADVLVILTKEQALEFDQFVTLRVK
jgi:hypothetical protein